MAAHYVNRIARDLAIEQSLDAAIELDEVIRGARKDSPALTNLVSNLMGPRSGEASGIKHDLLSDSQFASLYHRAALSSGKDSASVADLDEVVDLLFTADSLGVARLTPQQVSYVREFC